jgi:hypothetical protein
MSNIPSISSYNPNIFSYNKDMGPLINVSYNKKNHDTKQLSEYELNNFREKIGIDALLDKRVSGFSTKTIRKNFPCLRRTINETVYKEAEKYWEVARYTTALKHKIDLYRIHNNIDKGTDEDKKLEKYEKKLISIEKELQKTLDNIRDNFINFPMNKIKNDYNIQGKNTDLMKDITKAPKDKATDNQDSESESESDDVESSSGGMGLAAYDTDTDLIDALSDPVKPTVPVKPKDLYKDFVLEFPTAHQHVSDPDMKSNDDDSHIKYVNTGGITPLQRNRNVELLSPEQRIAGIERSDDPRMLVMPGKYSFNDTFQKKAYIDLVDTISKGFTEKHMVGFKRVSLEQQLGNKAKNVVSNTSYILNKIGTLYNEIHFHVMKVCPYNNKHNQEIKSKHYKEFVNQLEFERDQLGKIGKEISGKVSAIKQEVIKMNDKENYINKNYGYLNYNLDDYFSRIDKHGHKIQTLIEENSKNNLPPSVKK